jgi:hypothetical protein
VRRLLAVVASRPRSYDRGAQIENPAHFDALVAHKREARQHRDTARRARQRHAPHPGGGARLVLCQPLKVV